MQPVGGVSKWAAPLVVAVALAPCAGHGQDTPPPGMQITAGVEQRLTISDDGTFGDTLLSFGLLTETRRQRLSLDLGTQLRTTLSDDPDARFTDPFVLLGYTNRFTPNTELDVTLSYREAPVVDTGGNAATGPAQVFIGGGTREDTDARLRFTFGQERPVGGSLSLGYAKLTFSDTTNATLIPSETLSAGLNLRFDLSSRVTLTPSASISDITNTGGVDVRRERVGLGAQLVFSDVLTGGVELGATRLEEGGVTESGATATFSLSLLRPNGAISARFSTDVGPNGRRNNFEVNRSFDGRIGDLTLGFGVSQAENDELRPLYSLAYTREGKRNRITASLSQEFDIDANGREALNSRLRLAITTELTPQLRLSSSLGYSNSTVIAGSGLDTERFDASLRLSQELASDWRLNGGVNYTLTRSGGTETDTSELFLGLGRDFNWRP